MKMKQCVIVVLLSALVFSCKEDAVKSEQQLVIDYLLANGFTKDIKMAEFNKLNPHKIFTLDEAKNIVDKLNQLQTVREGDIISLSKSDSRVSLIACEDAGTYYISRAVDGLISGVDISYTIDYFGNIGNIYSVATGWTLAWSWDEIGSRIINPKSSFCINGIITYGVDISGLPLGYRQSVALRVTLRGCAYQVTSSYGSC